MVFDDSSGMESARTDLHLTPDPSANHCNGTFTSDVPYSDPIRLRLDITPPKSPHPIALAGPNYTQQQLKDEDYKLDLTLDSFGVDAAKLQAKADLQVAIKASQKYYASNGKSFAGLTPTILHGLAPTLTFNDSSHAVKGEVSLKVADAEWVLFTVLSDDGLPITMGQKGTKLWCYGEIDTSSPKACIAWQPSGSSGGDPSGGGASPNPPVTA